jgi:group I intron endonuclease
MKKWLCNESIMKYRKTTKGYIMSSEQKERLRLCNIGKKHTKETKEKISLANTKEKNKFYGKTHSQESKLKMKLNHKNRIEVIQFDMFGNEIKTYNSLREAERETKIPHVMIKRCVLNENKKINGFTWKIKKNENEENIILG